MELNTLKKELADKKDNYEQSVKYLYHNRSIQEKLMFIFSADNLNQMYRRMRYVRQYADYQRMQGLEVERKQRQVRDKQKVLVASREAKRKLLEAGQAEKVKLEAQEKERKGLLASLQKKQRTIQGEINQKRRSADKLNAQIDKLIAIEIEKARKRAEEEARRKATAENGRNKKREQIQIHRQKVKIFQALRWENLKSVQKTADCRAYSNRIKGNSLSRLPERI